MRITNQKHPNSGICHMIDQKRLAELLFKNIGVISLIIGASFIVVGTLNFEILPHYYVSQSGNLRLDSLFTIIVNGFLWLTFCGILLLIGIEFYFSGKKITKIELNDDGILSIRFCLLAAALICGTMIYLILLLVNVVDPVQFFPNVLFIDEETLIDLSIIFNTLLLYFLISILYRVAYKLIKFGLRIGGVK